MPKEIFTVIETADMDIISVSAFEDANKAVQHFTNCATENSASPVYTDRLEFVHNSDTIISLAGNAGYSVEIHKTVLK